MKRLSRRGFVKIGSALGAVLAAIAPDRVEAQATGFQAASQPGGPPRRPRRDPGIQDVIGLCEVTGGGQKVYGIAVRYDATVDPSSLALDTFAAGIYPASRGGGMMGGPGPGGGGPPMGSAGAGPIRGGGPGAVQPGQGGGPMPYNGPGGGPDMRDIDQVPPSSTSPTPANSPRMRPVAAIYTNAQPALLGDRTSVSGPYVILEFTHNPDLSLPTQDSDKVVVTQAKAIATSGGKSYAASATPIDNSNGRGNDAVVRNLDAWEQAHWWWDDTRATWLEYSIFLPKAFLQPGGENKEYPLVLAITHSGTSYDGTTTATLTEQCIAAIWALPEEQAVRECVVITPRYERTTMNDYWEHTYDVENTYRLVRSLMSNTWNYGNPNREETRDKVLKIDSRRVYTTGWSMGAMTSLWMMAKHPETFAAGLIMAGQQRPSDVTTLAQQNVLIITGELDNKATPWNEKCVPVWEMAGAKVTRPKTLLDPALIFPVDDQRKLNEQIDGYLGRGGNITFLTFAGVNHPQSAQKFFYIRSAREWLFRQRKA